MLRDHLLGRNFNPDLYKNIVLDDENELLTMYLNNLSGQFIGFQQYNPNSFSKDENDPSTGRYFTICRKGVIAVWGLETLDKSRSELFVVEGCFKASCLHMIGMNAIAVLASTPKNMSSWFHILKRKYNLIAIGDNDKAGRSLVDVVGRGVVSEIDLDEYSILNLKEFTDEILHRNW